jgi:cytochrome c biogenesis protein CcmG, thiol:disulfide interchange protein DsbE
VHSNSEVNAPRSGVQTFVWLVIFGLLGLLMLVRFMKRPSDATQHAGVGQVLLPLEVKPLLHTKQDFVSETSGGKPVLLHCWGPWCPPCLLELPEMIALEKKFRDSNSVHFVYVSYSASGEESIQEHANTTEAVIQKHFADTPIYHDPNHAAVSAIIRSTRMSDFVFPTTLLLDKNGIIRAIWEGYAPESVEEMEQLIDQYL